MNRRNFLNALMTLPFASVSQAKNRPLFWSSLSDITKSEMKFNLNPDAISQGASLKNKIINRLAFGSCANQYYSQSIWNSISSAQPDIFAMIGDNIYGDTEDMQHLAEQYLKLASNRDFQKFRRKFPIVATWDDHDYGVNDGGKDYSKKNESKNLFLNFFAEPENSLRRKREGIYTSYVFGDRPRSLQIILLDLRWFRSQLIIGVNGEYLPNPDKGASLLGNEQWHWLEEQLHAPADLRLLLSSTQLVSSEHRWEKWANFPAEKARLFDLIDRVKAKNLIVLSGDMHFAELSKEATPSGIEILDLTSSGLSHFESASDIANSKRLSLYDSGCNYGMVTINWLSQPRFLKLEIRNIENTSVIERLVRF